MRSLAPPWASVHHGEGAGGAPRPRRQCRGRRRYGRSAARLERVLTTGPAPASRAARAYENAVEVARERGVTLSSPPRPLTWLSFDLELARIGPEDSSISLLACLHYRLSHRTVAPIRYASAKDNNVLVSGCDRPPRSLKPIRPMFRERAARASGVCQQDSLPQNVRGIDTQSISQTPTKPSPTTALRAGSNSTPPTTRPTPMMFVTTLGMSRNGHQPAPPDTTSRSPADAKRAPSITLATRLQTHSQLLPPPHGLGSSPPYKST